MSPPSRPWTSIQGIRRRGSVPRCCGGEARAGGATMPVRSGGFAEKDEDFEPRDRAATTHGNRGSAVFQL